jgi:endonuclease/exonuclease/phosphatase family metal-dependent hydrolase
MSGFQAIPKDAIGWPVVRNCQDLLPCIMFKKLLMSLAFFSMAEAGFSQGKDLIVMTFNIRMNTPADGQNAWPLRKDKVASQILFHHVNILGVQEALHEQMVDLQQLLPGYKYAGVGRDDGQTKGEYSAIFYDESRLEPLRSNTFWLSETPNVPGSKGWDAAITRIVTWVYFKDKKTGKKFYAFNTHFDHIGKIARAKSAELLLQKIDSIAGKETVLLTGDFNSTPEDDPIRIVTDTSNKLHLFNTGNYSQQPHYGPIGTFNGWQAAEIKDEPIDYIFFKGKLNVNQHATLSQTWKGRFSSDHFPVMAVITLQ